jgi:hypothetical protein
MWTEINDPNHERGGRRHASDLDNAEWRLIEPHMPAVISAEIGRIGVADAATVSGTQCRLARLMRRHLDVRIWPNQVIPEARITLKLINNRIRVLLAPFHKQLQFVVQDLDKDGGSPAAYGLRQTRQHIKLHPFHVNLDELYPLV